MSDPGAHSEPLTTPINGERLEPISLSARSVASTTLTDDFGDQCTREVVADCELGFAVERASLEGDLQGTLVRPSELHADLG